MLSTLSATADVPASSGQIRPPLTILIVCDHAHVSGGLAQVAHASARALSLRGHRVISLAATPPVDTTLTDAGVQVHCLGQPDMLGDPSRIRGASRALWNNTAARTLLRLVENFDRKASIIHIHGWSKALSPSILHAATRSGLAVVQTMHDYVTLCPNGALYDYRKQQNCPLRPMSAACVLSNCNSRRYAFKLWRVVRHVALSAASANLAPRHVISLSGRQRAILAPLLPPGTRLHDVPNPVDVENRGPAQLPHEPFLFVGRLSAEKGPALFIEAARRAGVRARLAGDGPLRAELERQSPHAQFTGWLDAAGVTAQLRSARALVFPSLWYETFGLSVYEALANGVPAIVSDNTAGAEAIEHGVTGLLFRSGDVEDLARRMQTLAQPGAAEGMGLAAFDAYWARPLTLDRHVRALEDAYGTIIGDTRHGTAS